jgi:anti-sigma B factor antagonist
MTTMENSNLNSFAKITLSKYLTLEQENVAGITVIRPEGVIYIPEAEQFDKYMRESLKLWNYSLVLNFSRVKQLPSLVFATIIQTFKECQSHGGDLRFCSIPSSLMRVFVTMQFDRIFQIFDQEAEAVRSFSKT